MQVSLFRVQQRAALLPKLRPKTRPKFRPKLGLIMHERRGRLTWRSGHIRTATNKVGALANLTSLANLLDTNKTARETKQKATGSGPAGCLTCCECRLHCVSTVFVGLHPAPPRPSMKLTCVW